MSMNGFQYVQNSAKTEKYAETSGLSAYVRKVFNYMMVSLGITALVSYLMLRTDLIGLFLNVSQEGVGYSFLGYAVVFSPLLIIMYMNFNLQKISSKTLKIMLFAIAAIEGASISLLILWAGIHNAFQAFLLTGIIFGSMSMYGYVTKRNLLSMGSFFGMALWGLFIVSMFSWFTGGVGIWFSYAVVLIFTGLIAYETQLIKHIYATHGGHGETSDKLAVFAALSLYLSFINIFTALLRILGGNRD